MSRLFLVLFLSIFSPLRTFSEETQKKENFDELLNKVEKSTLEVFKEQGLAWENRLIEMIDLQKYMCQGEFSTVVIGDDDSSVAGTDKIKRLSSEERIACYHKVLKMQEKMVKTLKISRMNWAKEIYTEQEKQIEQQFQAELERIEKDRASLNRKN